MIILGGTYIEKCFEPQWSEIYGSGLRAVQLIAEFDKTQKIKYVTCGDTNIQQHLNGVSLIYENLEYEVIDFFTAISFIYDYPLRVPFINPRLDLYSQKDRILKAEGDNVLIYGMLEATFNVNADKVVYDPQSPINPQLFSVTSSTCNNLVAIVNHAEACEMSNKTELEDIKDFFFVEENVCALIIKMGAKGAYLFENIDDKGKNIPVFKTEKTWAIGTGDVFSAFFAYNWFHGANLLDSAMLASKAVAIYSQSKSLLISESLKNFNFSPLSIEKKQSKKIYLAGPFFKFTERWLVNEIYITLKDFGLNVFSPYHDVGPGKADLVVNKDIEGLEECEVIFAIIDGLDSGTLFEVGYAIAKNKTVIAYVQNETEESLKMLEGTACVIEDDLSTAIYKTYWYAFS